MAPAGSDMLGGKENSDRHPEVGFMLHPSWDCGGEVQSLSPEEVGSGSTQEREESLAHFPIDSSRAG